jgi:hypothetical protein
VAASTRILCRVNGGGHKRRPNMKPQLIYFFLKDRLVGVVYLRFGY